MKRYLNFILLLLLPLGALGQAWTSGSLTNGVNLINDGPVRFNYLQLTDSSGSVNTITLYDNDSASSTNRIIPAVSNARLTYSTNIVSTFTNRAGVVQTSTNTVLYTTTQTIAATTNEARRLYRITLPANGSVVFEPGGLGLGASFGLNALASSNATYNVRLIDLP